MNKNITIIKPRKKFINPKTHQKVTMKLVSVKEPVNVHRIKFTATHYYTMKINSNDRKLYPDYSDPHGNIATDYSIYRKKAGIMSPSKVKRLRRRWHLSQRDLSAISGISYTTLSDIENGRYPQSITQNNLLQYLLRADDVYRLISSNLKRVSLIQPKYVNIQKLISIAEKAGVKADMDSQTEDID